MLWHQPHSKPLHLLLAHLPQPMGINTEQKTVHLFLLLQYLLCKLNVFQLGEKAHILVQGLLLKAPLVQNVLPCHMKAHSKKRAAAAFLLLNQLNRL